MPRGGPQPGSGNPGYGALQIVKGKVKKHLPLWWEKWEELMNSPDLAEKKVAMSEFNKLQVKMMPTTIEGTDEAPLTINVVKYADTGVQVQTKDVSSTSPESTG